MNYLNFILRLKNYPINEAIKKLDEIQKMSINKVHHYHDKMKWEVYNHHINSNLSYSNFIRNKQIKEWVQIPILKKKDIQLPLHERLSNGHTIRNSHVHNTSGSTGTPFYFAKDRFCHALSWAIIYDRFNWHHIKNGKDLQARFYGIPMTGLNYYKEIIKDKIMSRVRFPIFDLSENILDKFLALFERKDFIYVNGYTSSLVMLAKHCIERDIVIKQICPSLQSVFTTSEVCDDIDRKILEKGFGVKIINEYGAAELDLIAFEDRDGDWLVNYETLYVEILDDNNMPVQSEEEGKVVVTSLYNKAMPFVRYDLGDRAILKDKNKGSYKILSKVVGRTNDIAVLPSGKRSPGLSFYYVSKKILEEGDFLKEFIVRQKTLNHFHFEYVAKREINIIEQDKISDAMSVYLEEGLTISYEKKDKIRRTNSGKLKHFYSDLNKKS